MEIPAEKATSLAKFTGFLMRAGQTSGWSRQYLALMDTGVLYFYRNESSDKAHKYLFIPGFTIEKVDNPEKKYCLSVRYVWPSPALSQHHRASLCGSPLLSSHP